MDRLCESSLRNLQYGTLRLASGFLRHISHREQSFSSDVNWSVNFCYSYEMKVDLQANRGTIQSHAIATSV